MDRTRVYPPPDLPVRDFLAVWTVPNQQDYLVVETMLLSAPCH